MWAGRGTERIWGCSAGGDWDTRWVVGTQRRWRWGCRARMGSSGDVGRDAAQPGKRAKSGWGKNFTISLPTT